MSPTHDSAVPAEERQINLLLSLRNTTVGMTVEEIVTGVAGYDPDNPVAARRMFERDKAVLRDLGIAITTGEGDEVRYSIAEDDYALPSVTLTADQAAAVDLAASAWRSGALTTAARHALTKIRAVAADGPRTRSLPALAADLAGSEIPPLLAAAVDERRTVSFEYASASSGTTRTRRVEPHRLRIDGGAWYLDALDLDSARPRTFRLARIAGAVTALSDPGAFVPDETTRPREQRALLAVAPDRALELRAGAVPASPGTTVPDALGDRDLLEVTYTDPLALAGRLASLGEAVVVLAPPSLREAVLDHLRGVAALDPAREA